MSGPASSNTTRPLRVAIVDRYVPLYREGLYDVLMAAPQVQATLVAAAKPIVYLGTVPYPGRAGWRWIDSPVHHVPLSRGRSNWQWGAARAGFSRRYDAVMMMANPNDPGLWLCALGARITGKRVIMWTHGVIRRDSPLRRFIRTLWLRLAHASVIYGHLGKVMAMTAGLKPQRLHVCYNSLDYSRQRKLRASITPAQSAAVRRDLFGDASVDAPIAVSLSRLNAFKKIDMLIRAHARLLEQGLNVRLLIVGDGPERGRLEALADELRVRDSVRFIGECYDEDRLSLLIAASDVAVTPGAIGLTVMHCLAYGVPCITHDDHMDQMPEFEAIIDSRSGGFFRKDDVDDLARVMRIWLDRRRDRTATAKECISQIERFYRPEIQAAVMLRALRGEDANDLWVAYQAADAWESTGH